jgi:flagellar hook assembly protein FlgD
MSNPLEAIGHGVKVAAEDVVKGVADAIEFLPKAEKVIATAIKDDPQVKTAVLELVKQAEAVIGDTASAAADKGINLADDAKALADAEAFFTWFKTSFVPLVEQIYAEVKTDLATPAPVAAPSAS